MTATQKKINQLLKEIDKLKEHGKQEKQHEFAYMIDFLKARGFKESTDIEFVLNANYGDVWVNLGNNYVYVEAISPRNIKNIILGDKAVDYEKSFKTLKQLENALNEIEKIANNVMPIRVTLDLNVVGYTNKQELMDVVVDYIMYDLRDQFTTSIKITKADK